MQSVLKLKRTCPKCERSVPIEEFSVGTAKAASTICKICRNLRDMASRKKRWAADPISRMLRSTQSGARQRGLEFTIARRDIVIPDKCPIFDIPLFFSPEGVTDNTPSLDRINNNMGYVRGNVAVISYKANRMKSDYTIDNVRRLLAYMEKYEW